MDEKTSTLKYKIEKPEHYFSIRNVGYDSLSTELSSDISDTEDVVSKLVSSVKELEIQKKVNKRKRWISALKTRRRYF